MLENIDGKVRSVQWKNFDAEVSGITDFAKALLDSGRYKPSDILILSPRRMLAYKIKDSLIGKDLQAHSFFHEEAIESQLSQRSITLLNLKIKPDDRIALRFWLGMDSKDWRARQYKILCDEAKRRNISVRELLDLVSSNRLNIKNITQIKKAYIELLGNLETLKEKSVLELINILFPEESDDTKILREASLVFLEANEDASVKELWEHLESMITQPETPEHGDYIRIMSLHKSKGLTSRVTIITNCIEGLIPRREKNAREELLPEQRRLFYVAMTRAKEYLVISSFLEIDKQLARNIGVQFGNSTRSKKVDVIASHFITETKIETLTGDDWLDSNFGIS